MPVEFPYQDTLTGSAVDFPCQGATSVVPPKVLRLQGFSPCMFRETISFSTMEEEQIK